jgi:Pentapeptide repeats (8 copies)
MADEHLLALLKSGAARWNHWRAVEPDQGLDLSSAVLTEADLRGFNLSDVNLSRAILRDALLDGSDLSNADLSFADLQRARLNGATLEGASFMGANLTGVDLSEVALLRVKITGAKYDQQPIVQAKEKHDRERLADSTKNQRLHTFPDNSSRWIPIPPPEAAMSAVGPREDFIVLIDGDLAPEEVQATLTALADYYRKCGGLGLKIRFRLEEAHVEELARVR